MKEGRVQKDSKVLSLDDLENDGAIDKKMEVKRSRNERKIMDSMFNLRC